MAIPSNARLVLLPFLQEWDGNNLVVRVVLLPKVPPLDPLVDGDTNGPSFATASWSLQAHLLGPDNLPSPGGIELGPFDVPPSENGPVIFKTIEDGLIINRSPPPARRPPNAKVRKYLPLSYRDFASGSNPLVTTGHEYQCARTQRLPATIDDKPEKIELPDSTTWGMIIAQLLKNPVLAAACGLIHQFSIPITDDSQIRQGGFVYLTLAPKSDGSQLLEDSAGLKLYATQFPPLVPGRATSLFSPCLFPLNAGDDSIYSDIFSEVLDYNDGFAKIVHCSQQRFFDPLDEEGNESSTPLRPVKESGVRLGWDDEQVTTWLNRQFDPSQPAFDSPLGVAGYRIDVRLKLSSEWTSLVRASGDVQIGTVELGIVNTELSVSVQPAQLDAKLDGTFWLPMYYESWNGSPLGSRDLLQRQLLGLPTTANMFEGIVPLIALQYGQEYEFRVRLMDTSGGGPTPDLAIRTPGPSSVTAIKFRRFIQPGPPTITRGKPTTIDPANPPLSIGVKRPLLTYPAIACTRENDVAQRLLDDIPAAKAEEREPGLHDPDVSHLRVNVQVFTFPQDPDADSTGFRTIYSVDMGFPEDTSAELDIGLTWTDVPNVDELLPAEDTTTLPVPKARQVRLEMISFCKDGDAVEYFGGEDVRTGPPNYVELRSNAADERNLYGDQLPSEELSAYYLRPSQPDQPFDLSDVLARFAAVLDMPVAGNTLRSKPGQRVMFGCTTSLPHQVGPDGASLTLSSKAVLTGQWIVVLRMILGRDWSWDGFDHDALTITRGDGSVVGIIKKTNALGDEAIIRDDELARREARSHTEVVFIDAINPLPAPEELPQELNPLYIVTPSFLGTPTVDSAREYTIRLPVTTPPRQTPMIMSAGIAMTPYVAAEDYSSSEVRQKRLWVEFDQALVDSRDAHFARPLRNVPDILIFPAIGQVENLDPLPALPIDPESIRHIVREQPADYAGLGAMVIASRCLICNAFG